jgi:hypothetical protein
MHFTGVVFSLEIYGEYISLEIYGEIYGEYIS